MALFFHGIRQDTFIMLLVCFSAVFIPTQARASDTAGNFTVIRDVVYGAGTISVNGQETSRDLLMDAYLPESGNRSAVIYTFGGSFLRGGRRFRFDEHGAQTTSPEGYCRSLASHGIACFAIEYRLMGENPVPTGKGYAQDLVNEASGANLLAGRANQIRQALGLSPLDPGVPADVKTANDAVIAAAEDLYTAFHFVADNATRYKVERDLIFLAGFSAGAITSLNVAHVMDSPVAGIILLSSGMLGFHYEQAVARAVHKAPVLYFTGQNDLPGVQLWAAWFSKLASRSGISASFAWVPGFGHFYPSGATSLGADATIMSVENRILDFIESRLDKQGQH